MAKYAGLSFGSLAYDPFGTAAPQIEFPSEEENGQELPQNPAKGYTAPQEKVYREPAQELTISPEELRAEAQARRFRRIVALVAIPVGALCAVLLFMLLQSYMALTAISNETSNLEKQVAELREENARLEIECESVFNMEEVEQTAHSIIGMVKADADQVTYLRSTSEDVAMVMDPPADETTLEKSAGFLRRILAHFRKG